MNTIIILPSNSNSRILHLSTFAKYPTFYSSKTPQIKREKIKEIFIKMKQKATQNRRILQVPVVEAALEGSELSPDPIFQPMNGSSETTIRRNPKQPTSPLDSSMALTILVLLTALFFMGFFSIYIRRFAEENSSDVRRRRHPSSTSSAPAGRGGGGGGVDPSIIKSLPLGSYCGGAKQMITDCPICLSEFEEKEIIKLIPPCRHVFHPECVDTWLSSHVSCPLCRSTQFLKVAGDEVCLDVMDEENGNGVSMVGGRSTVADCDTWRDVGMRRTCSCTSLDGHGHVVLQRSMSF